MSDNAPPPPKKNSRVTRILLMITLVGVVGFVALVGLIFWAANRPNTGDISDDTWVKVNLKGVIPDAPPPPDLFADPGKPRMTATTYARAIRKAAQDERVKGIFLDLEMPGGGWGRLQEVRSALVDFRATGKPCVAYAEVYDDAGYYLASACNKVTMAPSGISVANGIEITQTYYAETFDKIGVVPEFEHVGDFKSAIEVYERTGPSEPAAEAMNYLLDGLWDTVVADIAAGRGIEVSAARAMLDRPAMSPREALETGMVDALGFRDAVTWNIRKTEKEDWANLVATYLPEKKEGEEKKKGKGKSLTSIVEFAKDVEAEDASHDDQIAVVFLEGPIMSGKADGGLFGNQIIADKTVRSWIREVRKDDSVKAIVLRVNSPGGSGLASDMIWRELQLAKADGKKIVVSMADYAASGGYFVSMPADHVVAQPNTITGSIGVFGGKFDTHGAWEKMGMHQHQYKRGELADLFSPNQGFSDEGRAVYKRFLSDFYEIFLEKVAEGRSMDRDTVHKVAQGRVWTGTQALERDLVDEIGGLDVAVAKAAEIAGLSEGTYGQKSWPRKKELFELLMEDFQSNSRVTVELPTLLGVDPTQVEEVMMLEHMLDDGAVTLLPGGLTIE